MVYADRVKCVFMCSLGAYHDGQANGCTSEDQYIMATSPKELSDNNFLHPYQFSHCSVTYFRAYINRLNTYCTDTLTAYDSIVQVK